MGKSWTIVGFTIVFTILSLVLIIICQPIDSMQQSIVEPWMFKGAYATYDGQIDSLSLSYSMNETIQVTDLNDTHVRIQTNSSIATSFAPTFTD